MFDITKELSKLDQDTLKNVSNNVLNACIVYSFNGKYKRIFKELRRSTRGSERKIYKFLESYDDKTMDGMIDILLNE